MLLAHRWRNEHGARLTHCGPVTPYGNTDRDQHCLREWFDASDQPITWTNVESSSMRSSDIDLGGNFTRLLRDRLTHWGRVTHICVGKLTIIGSDNGLSPGLCQAIIWTNAGILLIRTLGTNFSEILGKIDSFSFKKMHLKMSSAKGRLFSIGLNELRLSCNYLSEISFKFSQGLMS